MLIEPTPLRTLPLLLAALLLASCGGKDEITENACLQASPTGQLYDPGHTGREWRP